MDTDLTGCWEENDCTTAVWENANLMSYLDYRDLTSVAVCGGMNTINKGVDTFFMVTISLLRPKLTLSGGAPKKALAKRTSEQKIAVAMQMKTKSFS